MAEHSYAASIPSERTIKNVESDHSYHKRNSKKKTLKEQEQEFFFHNLENFPEYDKAIIQERFVQSMALAGACCDITYEFKDDVIQDMGDYHKDIKLLLQIYLQEFSSQLSHARIFKVNPHIHAFFLNSLFDPEKGIYDPDTETFKPNDGTQNVRVLDSTNKGCNSTTA